MCIIGTSRRRGTSTILGTIIFVGIMFTAVIPMLLVMNQADTLHEMRNVEVGRLDEERKYEDLNVYVFNHSDSSESLTLRVENWGDFSVNINRVWVNDTYYILDGFYVPPKGLLEEELTGFTPIPDTNYTIKVTTDRGNVFFVDSGSIYCDEYGNWKTGTFAIVFYISAPGRGWFDIEIREGSDTGTILTVPPFSIHKSGVTGTATDFFSVPSAGTYHVKITRRNAGVIYNDCVTIDWPDGPEVEKIRV